MRFHFHIFLASALPIASAACASGEVGVGGAFSSMTNAGSGGTTTSSPNGSSGAGGAGTTTASGTTTTSSSTTSASTTTTTSSTSSVADAGLSAATFYVVRVGDGSSTLVSAATPVFLEHRQLDGTLVAESFNPIALPTAANGAHQPLTLSGTASSEGALSLSGDGTYLLLAGYGATPGTAAVSATSSAATPRVIARVDAQGKVDTSTVMNAAFSGGNVRGATSWDGSVVWVGGNGSNSTGGIWSVFWGTIGGSQIIGQPASSPLPANPPSNVRAVHIVEGQLYADAASGTFQGVFTAGSGLPTTQATATLLPGMPTTTGPSPYAFVLLDLDPTIAGLDTLYVADDRALASGGGVQKWRSNGATWALVTTFNQGLTFGVRGLAGTHLNSGVMLIATTTETSGNQLVTLFDDGTTSPAFQPLATAATNTIFRGVAFAPH